MSKMNIEHIPIEIGRDPDGPVSLHSQDWCCSDATLDALIGRALIFLWGTWTERGDNPKFGWVAAHNTIGPKWIVSVFPPPDSDPNSGQGQFPCEYACEPTRSKAILSVLEQTLGIEKQKGSFPREDVES